MKKSLLPTFALLFHLSLLFGQTTRYVIANKLSLREQPDKNFSVIQSLPQGTKVEVQEEYQDGWSKISVNGAEGYVSTNYLSVEAPGVKSHLAVGKSTPKSAVKRANVYICDSKTALVYHSSASCRGLNRCSHPLVAISQSEAINSYGRRACKICY